MGNDLRPYTDLMGLLEERWTCRQFTAEPVPRQHIEQLLELAQRTPSWCNTQPWQVTVTSGSATDRLRKAMSAHIKANAPDPDFEFPSSYRGIYRERRRECGYQLYGSVGIAKDDAGERIQQALRNFDFFDAPHVAILTTEADLGVYGAIDCGLWTAAFLLGAQSLGIAAAAQAALAGYPAFLRDHFGLPANRRVVLGISFGYPYRSHPINTFRTSRAQLSTVVNWVD